MLDKLGINPINLIAQIVNFAILFFVLRKFLFKPILHLLDERAKKVAEGLKAAEANIKAKEEFETIKKTELKKSRDELEKILAAARLEAKTNGEEIIKKARSEAQNQAEKEFQQMQQRLQQEEKILQTKIANMAVELTKKILKESLDPSMQKNILQSQIKKMAKLQKT